MHRHGLWLFGVLAAVEPGGRRVESRRLPRRFRPDDRAFHHQLRLEGRRSRLDVHPVFCPARLLRRSVGRLAGARRPAQGRRRRGLLLVGRVADRRARRLSAPTLAAVARTGRDRRHWSRAGLYFAGFDPDKMVSRQARHGDRHGDHGVWRRRDDRSAARRHADEFLQIAHIRRGLADAGGARSRLFRLYARRRLRLSRAPGGLASERLVGRPRHPKK